MPEDKKKSKDKTKRCEHIENNSPPKIRTPLDHPEVHPILEEEIFEGAPVLIRYEEKFYRGVISEEMDDEGDIWVWAGDWAIELLVRQEELYTLPKNYLKVPFQAVTVGLNRIRPAGGILWTQEALERTEELLESRQWTMIVSKDETSADAAWVDLEALDEEENIISASEILIAEGHAERCESLPWFDWGEDGGIQSDLQRMTLLYWGATGKLDDDDDDDENNRDTDNTTPNETDVSDQGDIDINTEEWNDIFANWDGDTTLEEEPEEIISLEEFHVGLWARVYEDGVEEEDGEESMNE